MKIAYVQAFYLPAIDGPATVIHEIASRLAKKGHEVHVFCSDSDKHKKIKQKEEVLDGVKIHRLNNWFQIGFATFFPSVFLKLMKEDFDIIHSHVSGHSYHFFSSLVRMIKKTPHVHTTHCCWTSGLGRSKLSAFLVWLDYKTVLPFSFYYSDRIIAITPWELDEIAKYNSNKNKVTVIPNGMDSVLLKKINNNDFRKSYGIPEDVKLVLFFGRLNPTKGVDKLAEAAVSITSARKDIHFAFVGPDEGMMNKVIEISKGNSNIHIMGPIRGKDKIAAMFQASDLYALPSYREGLPLTMFEAMASGRPIVASPVNGIPYEMKEPENGLFVKYGDVEGLKKAILKILDNPKFAKEIRANNLEKAKAYDWDIIAEKTLKVYESVLP